MGLITFRYEDKATGDPSRGYVTISAAFREAVNGTVYTTATETIPLIEGALTKELADGFWKIEESGAIQDARSIFVQVAGAADFTDLAPIDPLTLEPLPEVPSSVTELLSEATTLLTEVTARTVTATLDPSDPDVILMTYPAFMVDPDDGLILNLTLGASA
jgi:hypothetical protein